MKNRFIKRVERLRNDALYALGSIYVGCSVPSIYHSALGFPIEDENCKYDEIIWINGLWELVEHGTGNLFSVYNENLQDLCMIIDKILEKHNQ